MKAGKRRGKPGPRRATTKSYDRLAKLGKTMGNVVRADLLSGITTFKGRVSAAELAKAWKSGDYHSLFGTLPWDALPEDLSAAAASIGLTAHDAARITMEKMPPNVNKNLRFDMNNPQIRGFVQSRTGALVVDIQADTQKIIQDAIARSFSEALTPDQVAAQIKGSIGLYPGQERALANYRAGLVAQEIDPDRINLFTKAYEDRLLDYRARMIARTETRDAVNQGQISVWKEGVNQGLIDKSTAQKEWWVDGDPCETCDAMDGERVGLDELFIVGYPDGTSKAMAAPPAHPHCFCGVELHFIETSKADDED